MTNLQKRNRAMLLSLTAFAFLIYLVSFVRVNEWSPPLLKTAVKKCLLVFLFASGLGTAADVSRDRQEVFSPCLNFTTHDNTTYRAVLEDPFIQGAQQCKTYAFHKACLGPVLGFFTFILENTIMDGYTFAQITQFFKKSITDLNKDHPNIHNLINPYYCWSIYSQRDEFVGRFSLFYFPSSQFCLKNDTLNLSSETFYYEVSAYINEPYRQKKISTNFINCFLKQMPLTLAGRSYQLFATCDLSNKGTKALFEKFKNNISNLIQAPYHSEFLPSRERIYAFFKNGSESES